MAEAQGLHCPGCNQSAEILVGDEQAFCGNEDCGVFMWNPTKTLAELESDIAQVDWSSKP